MPPLPDDDILAYRARQASTIPPEIGVYALCDLDETPIYVGRSEDGVRARVRRHLTSARSDVIANRQLDVWEVAFVWAWPVEDKSQMILLEAHLFHQFNDTKTLMNGTSPLRPAKLKFSVSEPVRIRVMPLDEIETRKDPSYRLPRQAEHFVRLLDHILNVKDSPELRRSLDAHFERLKSYHERFLST